MAASLLHATTKRRSHESPPRRGVNPRRHYRGGMDAGACGEACLRVFVNVNVNLIKTTAPSCQQFIYILQLRNRSIDKSRVFYINLCILTPYRDSRAQPLPNTTSPLLQLNDPALPSMASLILPEPFASIPRESFLFGPSPIQHLPRISAALGGKVGVYAKREDCNSGLAYGGNKVRKLE